MMEIVDALRKVRIDENELSPDDSGNFDDHAVEAAVECAFRSVCSEFDSEIQNLDKGETFPLVYKTTASRRFKMTKITPQIMKCFKNRHSRAMTEVGATSQDDCFDTGGDYSSVPVNQFWAFVCFGPKSTKNGRHLNKAPQEPTVATFVADAAIDAVIEKLGEDTCRNMKRDELKKLVIQHLEEPGAEAEYLELSRFYHPRGKYIEHLKNRAGMAFRPKRVEERRNHRARYDLNLAHNPLRTYNLEQIRQLLRDGLSAELKQALRAWYREYNRWRADVTSINGGALLDDVKIWELAKMEGGGLEDRLQDVIASGMY